MQFSKFSNFLVVAIMLEFLMVCVSFGLSNNFYNQGVQVSAKLIIAENNIPKYVPPQKLANPPEIINAVYVTAYSAGTQKYLNYLSSLFKTTEINSVVVDIKGSNGYVSYASGATDVKKYNLYNSAIKDIDSLVRFFHDQNIYVIGRIANFEDPVYSKARPDLAIYNKLETTDLSNPVLWQDNNKLSWLDPSSKDVWDYNISLAKDALYHGFDEINFDYVRFPSDGKVDNMGFPLWDGKTPKPEIIKEFFSYVRQSLVGEKISVDLFGQTTINKDDMGIGQIVENAFENFDYVSPMVYPSHYISGFIGFANPADHPYEIIKYSMETALNRENSFSEQKQAQLAENSKTTDKPAAGLIEPIKPSVETLPLAKFRPWLQDFNIGAEYTADMVKAEIKATQDALGDNYKGFMLWNPSNIYTEDAVLKPS
ncbi:MAG: hypothetical protein NTY04_04090 [Candidatus Staskawiczbacteria bacterium]|nr:hypothetical protein [Candidatus Staskawiczbacteria bacterium]